MKVKRKNVGSPGKNLDHPPLFFWIGTGLFLSLVVQDVGHASILIKGTATNRNCYWFTLWGRVTARVYGLLANWKTASILPLGFLLGIRLPYNSSFAFPNDHLPD
ncbi:hypothetical protein EGR_00946 [Echinococcus granulosus]|uniref:Uncharacterized protein n=1 Tax=Echinococcus granulosus TaxID=6210 RepID=W6V0I4_ECHGR|nr:hypothetical protein EGR_00946 [Echinococcus granulosus]EUB64402.1 hypothetical protein EGR_00946 [Echinococcus granulosus]